MLRVSSFKQCFLTPISQVIDQRGAYLLYYYLPDLQTGDELYLNLLATLCQRHK